MEKAIKREDILKSLRAKIAAGIPVIGSGAGTGISAKSEELGGTDMIICYNSGAFRMQGRPSACGHQPLGDANTTLMELAAQVLPVVDHTPVIAGVYAPDPFRFMSRFLKEVKEVGFSGVQNFPTYGCYEGKVKAELEQVGFSYQREVDMIKMARDMDLLTTPYVYDLDHTERMVKAGADIIVAHCGCTVGGTIGVDDTVAMALDESCKFIQEIHDYAVSINPDIIVIAHGGPVATPEDFKYVFQHTKGVAGFYGASSMERLPVERAISECVQKFAAVRR